MELLQEKPRRRPKIAPPRSVAEVREPEPTLGVEAIPLARLHPAPWNLVRSIQADPDFLWRRPILATADGTIYAGNMRYRAAQHLGMAIESSFASISGTPGPRIPEIALVRRVVVAQWLGGYTSEVASTRSAVVRPSSTLRGWAAPAPRRAPARRHATRGGRGLRRRAARAHGPSAPERVRERVRIAPRRRLIERR